MNLFEAAHLRWLGDQRRRLSRREWLRLRKALLSDARRGRRSERSGLRDRRTRPLGGRGTITGGVVRSERRSAETSCRRTRPRTLRGVLRRLLVSSGVLRRRMRTEREELDADRAVLTGVLIVIAQAVHTATKVRRISFSLHETRSSRRTFCSASRTRRDDTRRALPLPRE